MYDKQIWCVSSSEIQQLRQERDLLNVHGRNLETEKLACQSAVRSLEANVAQILHLRGMLEVERQMEYFIRKSTDLSTCGYVK